MQPIMDAQTAQQTRPRNLGGNPHWRKGISGNPTGMSRKQRRLAEFTTLFKATHHRAPNPAEIANLKGAAAAAARLDRQGLDAEDIVRLANVQSRLLDRLGLSGAPAKSEGVFPDHGLQGGTP
jgi:hypothetical protein